MMGYDDITETLGAWNAPRRVGDYLIVPTFSTYPSNSLVQVYIEGCRDRFVVSDGGGAVKTLMGAGSLANSGKKVLSDFVRGNEIRLNPSGWLCLTNISLDGLTAAISVIAETSRDAAITLLKHFKPPRVADYTGMSKGRSGSR
jgi:hypothetical protein